MTASAGDGADNKMVILACSSLTEYVEAAQQRAGTAFPVIYLNRLYHRDPKEMQQHICEALTEKVPAETDTVLVAMGFCGGSWEGVSAPFRLVLPRIDDCVSLLLQTGDTPVSDLKEPGHLYVRAKDPKTESFKRIFDRLTEDIEEETKTRYHEDWKQLYSELDIMDTGINGCRNPEYKAVVQEDADWLDAQLKYVSAGTYLLEKLFGGNWDEQFLVLESKSPVERSSMLIG